MKDGRWRITVTAPDWGQDHLSSDAIVAFVDDELAHGPHARATQHLGQCRECAAQVVAQGQARSALRTAECPSLPSSLLSSLRSIPQDADLPAPPPGLSVTADGQLVSVIRAEPAGLAERADLAGRSTEQGRRPPAQRRIRLSTGVAVSGLALGAIAFGAPTAPAGSGVPVPTAAERGVLGGPLLGGPSLVEAQLRTAPGSQATRISDPVLGRSSWAPGTFRGLR